MSANTKQTSSQNVQSEGILTSALNTAKDVARAIGEKTSQVTHTLGEKIGFDFSNAENREFATFTDPLASPKELALMKSQLKHVQTRDNSKPVIGKDVHIVQNNHGALFAGIKQRPNLKHVEKTRDASAPFIGKDMKIKESPQKQIFVDIREHHYNLKHVTTNDRSSPRLTKDVLKQFNEKTSNEGILTSALNTAKQVSHTLGEKTQQVAWTLGAKTSQVAHTLEEKIGYKFTPGQKEDEFVKFTDLLASPKDLALVRAHLKHVTTRDSSNPVIDKDIHIQKNSHGAIFAEIRQRKNQLKHVEKTRDASAPFLHKDLHMKESPRKQLFADIREHHYQLKHVQTRDRSSPFIPRNVHIDRTVPIPSTGDILEAGKEKISSAINTAKQVTHNLGEKTQQAAHTIGEKTSQAAHTIGEKTSQAAHTIGEKTQQAAQTIGEKTQQAAHTIGEKTSQALGYKATPEQRTEEFVKFVDNVANPKELVETKSHLKHIQTRDKSRPVIENNVHIKENHHKELLAEIGQRHDLHHVKTEHDASKPFIDRSIHIGEAPQKRVLEDITQHHSLKHVKMNDKSAPVISPDVHIKFVE